MATEMHKVDDNNHALACWHFGAFCWHLQGCLCCELCWRNFGQTKCQIQCLSAILLFQCETHGHAWQERVRRRYQTCRSTREFCCARLDARFWLTSARTTFLTQTTLNSNWQYFICNYRTMNNVMVLGGGPGAKAVPINHNAIECKRKLRQPRSRGGKCFVMINVFNSLL